VVRGLDISARYLAAAEGTRVGGDWYDVINLSKDRVLLTVGDVVGQGPSSAALMGQLRTLMHEAALRESDPAATVSSLDAIAARTSEAFGSTCVAVELDAESGALRYCRAGHPWPLVVGAAGERWLDVSGGAPLGVGSQRPSPATDHLAPGEALVLFTDGAVERRGEDVDRGLAEMADAARSAAGQGADAICDAVLERVSSPGGDDLVLLVAARPGP
jgi:serine phosphatase RsbU (regulator of sigma subunit)